MKTKQRGTVSVSCIPSNCGFFEYTVMITDSRGKPIYCGETSKDGFVRFEVDECDEYQIRVESRQNLSPRTAYRWVTLHPDKNSGQSFSFNPRFSSNRTAAKRTICLTDKNYNGLPITKGEMYLWQVPM